MKHECNLQLLPVHLPSGGRGRIMDTPPVREVVVELKVRYQRKIEYKSYSTAFNEVRFHKNSFPQKDFP